MSRAGRVIHPFRTSGHNPRPTPAHPAPAVPQQPSAARTAPLRPADARTPAEAFSGLLRASQPLRFTAPRFLDRLGSWIRLGAHEIRVPLNSMVAIQKAHNGLNFALVSGIDGDQRFWVLIDKPEGIREVQGLSDSFRTELRRAAFQRNP